MRKYSKDDPPRWWKCRCEDWRPIPIWTEEKQERGETATYLVTHGCSVCDSRFMRGDGSVLTEAQVAVWKDKEKKAAAKLEGQMAARGRLDALIEHTGETMRGMRQYKVTPLVEESDFDPFAEDTPAGSEAV